MATCSDGPTPSLSGAILRTKYHNIKAKFGQKMSSFHMMLCQQGAKSWTRCFNAFNFP